MKSLLIASSFFALLAPSAFAADLAPQPVEPAVPVVLPYSWTGFYVGLHAGAIFTNSSARVGGVNFNDLDDTAFIGGAHAGYNYQFDGGFVVGLEGDIDYTSLDKDTSSVLGGVLFTANIKSEWQGSIRARVGYAFDRFLPYITGGVAFGDEKFTAVQSIPFARISNSDTRTGWTIGGGLEYAVTDNWLVRGEVRYTDFGHNSFTAAGVVPVRVKLNEVSTTLGVSYKF
jgi:outer membrane immunogenic protein